MNIFTVSFFGHRQIGDSLVVEKRLEKIIRELLLTKEYLEFLVGRDGEFDQIVASTVRRCKRNVRDDNSELILILPYVTSEYRNNVDNFHNYYDGVEVCDASAREHFKAVHQIRNRFMIDRSDLVIFYVERCSGGAYQTMKYADRNGAKYINLFDITNHERPRAWPESVHWGMEEMNQI